MPIDKFLVIWTANLEVKSGKSYYIVDFEKRKLLSKEGYEII